MMSVLAGLIAAAKVNTLKNSVHPRVIESSVFSAPVLAPGLVSATTYNQVLGSP